MKVARNTTHGLRHDCLAFTDKGISVQLRAHRNEIWIEVEVDGRCAVDYFTPHQLAVAIIAACAEPHEK